MGTWEPSGLTPVGFLFFGLISTRGQWVQEGKPLSEEQAEKGVGSRDGKQTYSVPTCDC